MSLYNIDLKNDANQTFTKSINNMNYQITLSFKEIMLFSLIIDGETICQNERCFANQPILPYKWQWERAKGNFVFNTQNDQYPIYTNFNTSCLLYFLTEDELQ